jgi:hypothetical protein
MRKNFGLLLAGIVLSVSACTPGIISMEPVKDHHGLVIPPQVPQTDFKFAYDNDEPFSDPFFTTNPFDDVFVVTMPKASLEVIECGLLQQTYTNNAWQTLSTLGEGVQELMEQRNYNVKDLRLSLDDLTVTEKEDVILAVVSEVRLELSCSKPETTVASQNLDVPTSQTLNKDGVTHSVYEDYRLQATEGKFKAKATFYFYLTEPKTKEAFWRKVIEGSGGEKYTYYTYETQSKIDLSTTAVEVLSSVAETPVIYDQRLDALSEVINEALNDGLVQLWKELEPKNIYDPVERARVLHPVRE